LGNLSGISYSGGSANTGHPKDKYLTLYLLKQPYFRSLIEAAAPFKRFIAPNCLPFSVKVSYTFSSPCEASGKVASARGVASARYPFGMMPHLREIRRAGCSGLRR
jgi:hypothetical protein